MAAKLSSPVLGSHPDLVELVTCSICLEYCKDARALPCLHSYCKGCLQGLVTPQGKISCPHCRLECEVPNGDASNLKQNFMVNNVLDVLSSVNDDATTTGDAMIATNLTSCKNHPEKKCELFCQHCSKLICYKCISNWGTCGQHTYESIETTVKMYRKNVEDFLQERVELLPSVRKHGVTLTDMKAKQSENVFDVSKQISDSFAKHMESLKQRQDMLTRQAFDMQWNNDDELSSEIDRVQLKQAKIENTIEFCEKILDVKDPAVFLKTYSKIKDEMFQSSDCEELVSHVDLAPVYFQATDALLTDVISNFGNVLSSEEACAAEEEKLDRAERPSTSKQRYIPTSGQQANERPPFHESIPNERRPVRPSIPRANNHPGQHEVQPVTWKLYNKNWSGANVIISGGLSATTVNEKNVAIIGKPGFHRGRHSWRIKVSGFSNGLGIGVCVGYNGAGITVSYDSKLKYGFGLGMHIEVAVDCDAKVLSVKPTGYEEEIVNFSNPASREVHPYFYLHGRSEEPQYNNITVVSMDGKAIESKNDSCCVL